MINIIYYCLIGIIYFYTFFRFNNDLPKDTYLGIKALFLGALGWFITGFIFIIINKYFYKITIIDGIKSQMLLSIIGVIFFGFYLLIFMFDDSDDLEFESDEKNKRNERLL